jgi:primosomal protein N' (replication factor Y)
MEIIDMSLELKNGNASIFSNRIKQRMNDILEHKAQAILVMNQKGYAPFVMCRRCGHVPKDPMTQVPLTYYENEQLLKSNFRAYQEPYATLCPNCGKPAMKPVGFGVEFVESSLKRLYPNASIARVDATTMSSAKQRQTTLEKVSQSSFIVGTELALKQINSKTKLISILLADQFLQVPSYQAHEKAYRLLKELTLHEDIDTVVQTYNPNHKILQYVIGNKTDEFYKEMLNNRKLLGLPPYEKVAQILLEGKSYLKTFQDAHYIKSLAIRYGMTVLGPVSSHVFKLKDLYRVIVTLKYQVMDQDIIDYINSYSNQDIKLSYYPGIKWN